MTTTVFPRLIAIACLCLAGPGTAATLAPGQSVLVPATDAATTPALNGTPLTDTSIPLIFATHPAFPKIYTYEDRAVRSDGTGRTLITPQLIYQSNVSASPFLFDGFTLTGYQGFATDIFYRTDMPGDRGPTTATRSADGDSLTFLFALPLYLSNLTQGVHENSYPITILTDGNSYQNTGRGLFFGHDQSNPGVRLEVAVTGLAVPAIAPVPLPASALMLLAGLAGLAAIRRRKTTGPQD
ncbi:MAG: VPLPA-CTERM sorting domain-containing protein [Qingshengfaniella sp.]